MTEIKWTPGMRVAVGDRITTVERVTPTGMPVVDGKMYRKDGWPRGESASWRDTRPWVRPLTPELEAEIAERHAVRFVHSRWIAVERNARSTIDAAFPGWGRLDARAPSAALSEFCDAIEAAVAKLKAARR